MEENDTSVFIELKDLENYKKEAEENKVLRSQIEELKAELQQLNEHLRLHKGDQELHQSLVEENKKLVRTLQNSNEVLESKMAQLKQTIENLVKESKLKDETIQHQLENIFMFEKRVQTLEQSLEKTESQSQRHLEEKKALVARLDELSKHASDNQWENLSKSLIAENKHLKDRLASSDDEKKSLLEKIATKEKLIDSQNKTIAQISKEGEGNLSSLKEAKETINRLNIEVSKEKKQVAEYRIESQKLRAETKSLLEKIAELDKKLKDISTKNININEELVKDTLNEIRKELIKGRETVESRILVVGDIVVDSNMSWFKTLYLADLKESLDRFNRMTFHQESLLEF